MIFNKHKVTMQVAKYNNFLKEAINGYKKIVCAMVDGFYLYVGYDHDRTLCIKASRIPKKTFFNFKESTDIILSHLEEFKY